MTLTRLLITLSVGFIAFVLLDVWTDHKVQWYRNLQAAAVLALPVGSLSEIFYWLTAP